MKSAHRLIEAARRLGESEDNAWQGRVSRIGIDRHDRDDRRPDVHGPFDGRAADQPSHANIVDRKVAGRLVGDELQGDALIVRLRGELKALVSVLTGTELHIEQEAAGRIALEYLELDVSLRNLLDHPLCEEIELNLVGRQRGRRESLANFSGRRTVRRVLVDERAGMQAGNAGLAVTGAVLLPDHTAVGERPASQSVRSAAGDVERSVGNQFRAQAGALERKWLVLRVFDFRVDHVERELIVAVGAGKRSEIAQREELVAHVGQLGHAAQVDRLYPCVVVKREDQIADVETGNRLAEFDRNFVQHRVARIGGHRRDRDGRSQI